ncbi:MAG TPA: DUF1320 family protein [bacterium]|nr:DUF1320 family protein [bacterium]
MSKYITKEDFIARYPVFSDHTKDEISIAITDAESIIDGYLGTKFTVNPDDVPAIIVRISATLAYYYIMQANLQVNSEEDYTKVYNSCIELLEKIVSGTITGIEVADANNPVTIISTGGSYEYRC